MNSEDKAFCSISLGIMLGVGLGMIAEHFVPTHTAIGIGVASAVIGIVAISKIL